MLPSSLALSPIRLQLYANPLQNEVERFPHPGKSKDTVFQGIIANR